MTTPLPIIDLHCDLLYYLAENKAHTARDRIARASIPQLEEGNVLIQVLAIYSDTENGSQNKGRKQFEIFENLLLQYPQEVSPLHYFEVPKNQDKIHFIPAIENASGLCGEEEDFAVALKRLESVSNTIGPLLYLSLTWNEENRFGGGNSTTIGLKPDGEALLEALAEKGIAIDLSHTSDQLAHDILNAIVKKGLNIIPIASHSNFRSVVNAPRNLPDEFAKEIILRGGVIGLNFVRKFIGTPAPLAFLQQIEYAAKLGGLNALCMGADFFYEGDFHLMQKIGEHFPFFHDKYDSSACYPLLFKELSNQIESEVLEKIAFKNCATFFTKMSQLQNVNRLKK